VTFDEEGFSIASSRPGPSHHFADPDFAELFLIILSILLILSKRPL
jgi:hypothetical protein